MIVVVGVDQVDNDCGEDDIVDQVVEVDSVDVNWVVDDMLKIGSDKFKLFSDFRRSKTGTNF